MDFPSKPRANPRKPVKKDEESYDEPERLERAKRQRKAPDWITQDYSVDELPFVQLEPAKRTAEEGGRSGRSRTDVTRIANWTLTDQQTLVVELEHGGKKYRGVLKRSGPSPQTGIVQEDFDPASCEKDQCALCNMPLPSYPEGDEELNKIVRVNVSTSWIAYVHLLCALWAPEVFEDKHGNLVNLSSAVRRSRGLRCTKCRERGAALCCTYSPCQRVYHLPCARQINCDLDEENFKMSCPTHARLRHSRSVPQDSQ